MRDLLRQTEVKADVITVLTYFNKGIPAHPSMDNELQSIIRNEEVPDYHHFVRAQAEEGLIAHSIPFRPLIPI